MDPFGGYQQTLAASRAASSPRHATSPAVRMHDAFFDPNVAFSPEMEFARDVSTALSQGSTFGFIDELIGEILGEAAKEETRARQREFVYDYPGLNTSLNLLGAVGGGPGVAGMSAARAAGGGTAAQLLAGGGVGGAVAGAGTEVGTADEDFSEESALRKAARGGTSGALMGLGLGSALMGGGYLGKGLWNLVRGGATADDAAQAVADTKVVESLRSAGKTVDDVDEALRQVPPESRGAYAIGDTTRQTQRLARGAEAVPGRGSEIADEFYTGRGEGMLQRMENALSRVFRAEGRNFHRAIADIAETRAAEGDELYRKAFEVHVGRGNRVPAAVETNTVEMSRLMSRPIFKRAYNAVRQMKRDIAGEDLPSLEELQRGAEDGMIDARTVDLVVRRGINRLLDRAEPTATQKGDPQLYRELTAYKQKLMEELDWVIPGYAKARAAYSDKSNLIEAAKDGFDFDRRFVDADHLTEHLGKLTDQGREMFMLGVARKLLDDMLGKTGGDLTRGVTRNAGRMEKLRGVLGPDDFEALEEVIKAERKMHQTRGMVLGGSPTARITEEVGGMPTEQAMDMLQAVITRSVVPIARMGARARSRAQGISPEVSERVMRTATTTADDPALQDTIERLRMRTGDLETALRRQSQVQTAIPAAGAAETRQLMNPPR